MRSLCKITDDCISKMKPNELWSWEDWWEKVIKNGPVPRRKTYAFERFIAKRSDVKKMINDELERREKPERLMCVGVGKGIYLVNEKEVAEITVSQRVRKIVSCFENTRKQTIKLACCERISGEDKKMLSRISGLVELQQNTMIGTMAKMKSLPSGTKKRLLKKLGIEP